MRFVRFLFSRFFIYNILIITISLCVFLFALNAILNIAILHKKTVFIPSMNGITLKNMQKKEWYSDFEYEILDSTYVDSLSPEEIISVYPNVGSEVTKGRKLYLTVNVSDKPMVRLPNVLNASYGAAKQKLLNKKIYVDSMQYVDDIAKKAVVGVMHQKKKLRKGQKIRSGTHVWLLIGNGNVKKQTDSLSF